MFSCSFLNIWLTLHLKPGVLVGEFANRLHVPPAVQMFPGRAMEGFALVTVHLSKEFHGKDRFSRLQVAKQAASRACGVTGTCPDE